MSRFLVLLWTGALAIALVVANEARAAVAFGSAGNVAQGTTSLSVPYPSGIAAGDLLVLAIGNKYPPNGPATPAGWTLVTNGQGSGGSGAAGGDSGTVYATFFVKVADGSESGNLTVTLTGANSAMGRMFRYTNAANAGWDYAATNGSDNTPDTNWTASGAANPGITSGDMLIVVSAVNGNRITAWGSESVSAVGATFGVHTEQQDSTTGQGDDMGLVVSDHTVTGGTAVAAPVFTMTVAGGDPRNDTPAGASAFLRIREVPGTALGNGTDPGNASLAPGGAATMADAFTLQTSSGTDTITDVTVDLGTGASPGLSLVEIASDDGATVYGSVTNPASDTPTVTLSTATLTATTTLTQYKIRITPKSHAAMPVPPGATYTVTAKISAWTGTNTQVGSDTAGTTVTIDNQSPGNVTPGASTAGDGQVTLVWTNPGDADLERIVVLRDTSAVADAPAEGATYSVGDTVGASVVRCVVTPPTATCTDTGLTNGTAYHYKIFTRDTNGNYAAGVVPTGSPFTPFGPGCYAVASANWNVTSTWAGTSGGSPGTCPGAGNIPDSSTPVFIGETSTAYNVTIPAGYAAQAANVTLGGSGTNNAKSLTLAAASASLAVGGNLVIYNPANDNTNVLNVNAGTVTVGSGVTLNGTNTNNNRIARINVTTGTLTIGGGLTYNAADRRRAVIDMSGGAGTLNLGGALTINTTGTLTPGTTSTFNFNGASVAQTIPLGVSDILYNHLHVNNTSSGGATLSNNDITTARVTGNLRVQSGTLNDGGFDIAGGTGLTFEVANGATFVFTTNNWVSGYTRSLGATSTVEYARSGNQDVATEDYGHLTLRGSGTKRLPAGTLNVRGNLSMGGTAALDHNNGTVNLNGSGAQTISLNSTNSNLNHLIVANTGTGVTASGNVTLEGNFTNNGVFSAGSSTFIFAGNSSQTIGGTSATTFYNLTANNTAAGASDIVLGLNTTVNNTLTFSAGNISTGSNTLIIGNTGNCGVAGAATNQHVIGYLRKNFTASLLDCTFEVGEGTLYAPVRVVFDSVTASGYVTASTTVGDHPQIATSSINPAQSVNRYWTLTPGGGLAFGGYAATFNYNAADLDASVTPDDFIVQRFESSAWFNTNLSNTIPPTGTATVIEGETGFGDFAVGESTIVSFTQEREFIYQREVYY